jgi:hypothetical protein
MHHQGAGGQEKLAPPGIGRTERRNAMTRKTTTLVGAGIGLALFLALGLLPSLVYGGYAGVLLAGGIFGTPLKAAIGARILIVLGMALSAIGVGSLFAVAGAALGAAVGTLVGAAPSPARPKSSKA